MENKRSTHQILIEQATFHSYHGVHDEEHVVGGKFEIDLLIQTNFDLAANHDKIEGTVDYSKVYSTIKEEVEKPSKLIEHLAKRIIDRIKTDFQGIDGIRIKIRKLNPPISGEISSVSVVIEES